MRSWWSLPHGRCVQSSSQPSQAAVEHPDPLFDHLGPDAVATDHRDPMPPHGANLTAYELVCSQSMSRVSSVHVYVS